MSSCYDAQPPHCCPPHRLAEFLLAKKASLSQAGQQQSQQAAGRQRLVQLQALAAALLFAVHPVHTEAVAGIVGQAELICAALSIPALLMYFRAADSTAGSTPGAASSVSMLEHWRMVCCALLLAFLSALAKEIGITVVGGAVLCAA